MVIVNETSNFGQGTVEYVFFFVISDETYVLVYDLPLIYKDR